LGGGELIGAFDPGLAVLLEVGEEEVPLFEQGIRRGLGEGQGGLFDVHGFFDDGDRLSFEEEAVVECSGGCHASHFVSRR
jgi:hypothetical protein